MPSIFAALLLATALGSGMATLADRAAPGTPFYIFKVEVNDRVASTLIQGENSTAQMLSAVEIAVQKRENENQ